MSSSGIEFEILVRDLEMLLQYHFGLRSDQVRSEWRYKKMGKDSGKHREVDVALFTEAGWRTLFIAIECRDRKGKQGCPWIEQLATKRLDISADRMVAVSRDGFTKPAQRLAEKSGIELYTLADRTAFGDGKELADLTISIMRPLVRIMSFGWSHCRMSLSPLGTELELAAGELASLSKDFEGANWLDTFEGKKLSFKDIILRTLTWEQLIRGIPVGSPPIVQDIENKLPYARYRHAREYRDQAFIALTFVRGAFEVQWERELISPKRILQYRAANQPVIELHEYDGKIIGLDGQTIFFAPIANKPSTRPQQLKVN